MTTLCVAAYTIFGGWQVTQEEASLGMFLTDLSVLTALGSCFQDIYILALKIQMVFPGLKRVVRLLNGALDLPKRMNLVNHVFKDTESMHAEVRERMTNVVHPAGLPIDLLQIVLANVQVSNARTGHVFCFKNEMVVDQSSLVCLVAGRGNGKTTLLKIIGGVILPTINFNEGAGDRVRFFMPSHLRVLHVPAGVSFYNTDLLSNLTLGVAQGDPDGDEHRVLHICRRLGLDEKVAQFFTSKEVLPWMEVFSTSQSRLLCLARALVANSELMVLQTPTIGIDELTTHRVLHLLREYIDLKGVDQSEETRAMRRPRTCIFSTTKVMAAKFADKIFHVDATNGIREVTSSNITADMLQ
eukprot:gnl/TRDRNA2_/TRDRNA2_120014_c1_seq2.p1 gnl/TRDRNA2_/TRDRNA2_120014_c1~~gnl/TRDRNA2_/TRDRNA2_120014_c1_seq2.p1  ORF type:complete len:356 (+),score=37.01 gnl/TRDRNA2_/TRDRNA2_120014_c1_seq2:189-1256(+)